MSFRCENCGLIVRRGQKATTVTVRTRRKKYPGGSYGTECAKQMLCCLNCAELIKESQRQKEMPCLDESKPLSKSRL